MSKEWKIYTKTGDKGETSLIGGIRVPKSHEKIEAYGTLDEANSFIGVVLDSCGDEEVASILRQVQERLFVIESWFAAASPEAAAGLPALSEEDIEILEKEIDRMNASLPALASFILPSGHPLVSATHVARTVCRRAERCMVRIAGTVPCEKLGIKYVNRLSDYLFVLARKFCQDLQVPETLWKPRKEK